MPEALVLKAEYRKQTGSKKSAAVRSNGRIPAIIYGHKQEPTTISLNEHDFTVGLHHSRRLFDVQLGKKTEKLLVKELQYDYLGKKIIHADFMRVNLAEKVKVSVPIELKGTAKGTHESGIIEEHVDHLEVECKVTDIPEVVSVSVKELGVGDALHAGEISLPEGVQLVSSAELLVVTCHLVAAAKTTEELEEEVPAAPEVITEKQEQLEEPQEEKQKGKSD